MSLIVLLLLITCWIPVQPACSPVREGGSTLTINSVSRTDPLDMEVKWTCEPCTGDSITVCDKLEVYAPPESPSCTLRENTESGDIKSVTVSCSTSKVYPRARCRIYREKDGGNSVEIATNSVYSHTETGETPVYYRSQCSVTVPVQELGEGTYSFTGYIYPGVTGDPAKVTGTRADKTVTLSFSQASHSCRPQAVQGYFLEESTTCTCSLSSDGHPRGSAQWYKGGQQVGSSGTLVVTRDKSNPEQIIVYTCEAVSDLGRTVGSTLTAKFAFIITDSVEVESTPDTINLCDNNNSNNQAQVTCRVSKENINPEPTFSFSSDGLNFDPSYSGTVSGDGSYFQSQFSLSPDTGGEYQMTCRVTNTVLNTWQDKRTVITFRKPPPAPPQMTVGSESYQGVSPSNIVTLTEGYFGDVTCRVEGGYPAAHTTQLKCGQLVDTGAGHTAALSFKTDQLTREMNGAVCTCTSQHDSGCYSNKETQLALNVLYAPKVTFTLDPAQTTFSKGDNLELKCSAQGNPDTTLTLTTKETIENLTNVQSTELTHTLTLGCMDTGVYVCSGQNNQGTNRTEISIGVRCPQQLSPMFNSKPQVDAVTGENAKFGIQIYGFPEPSTLTLQKTEDVTNLIYSPRHTLKYTAGVAPFGVVNVTISDVVEADYTNYTLTVDNGVGSALIYTVYLNKVNTSVAWMESIASKEDSFKIVAIVISIIALVIIAGLIIVIIFLLKKNRGLKERLDSQYRVTLDTGVSANLPDRPGQYETIDDIPSTTPVLVEFYTGTGQYETIQDKATTS
ncbi:hypothetical protein RRG08_065455 [Elysia crispata]|uniref:Ig-like domain-containing protein n=1 Tax=Elysia crispata TaxID=231223 RepID=A0AAE0YDJ2_9GAST|nr:hypothetical protein RRG08_065455 [Elysia crispata]